MTEEPKFWTNGPTHVLSPEEIRQRREAAKPDGLLDGVPKGALFLAAFYFGSRAGAQRQSRPWSQRSLFGKCYDALCMTFAGLLIAFVAVAVLVMAYIFFGVAYFLIAGT